MIDSIKTVNFQSLQDVDIEFGDFTVIVGASSSGKSALTRAMKAVTSNSLDSDYITRGSKKSAVSLRTQDTTVTIERELGGSSVYKIAKVGSKESRFARLNRQVPAEVTEALGMLPSTQEVASINFAGQFDTPYLLKEGSSSVARVLGELTNVSTIFAAVKEASRRVKSASSLLNLRKKDQQQLLEDLKKFTDIGNKAKSITLAEVIMAECLELEEQISILQRLLGQLDRASERFVEIPVVPDLTDLLEAYKNFNDYKYLVRKLLTNKQAIFAASSQIKEFAEIVELEETKLHATLISEGTCPTCNQQIVR
jgi:predicted ATP-dependent endonuclease of OLD family